MLHGMAKPLHFTEKMVARFRAGTFDRIDAVLDAGETRADLVRTAVERELRRRARAGRNGDNGRRSPKRRRTR
jgi:hypothetical protein